MTERAVADISSAATAEELERQRVEHLGQRSHLRIFLSTVGRLPADQRPQAGRAGNEARQAIEAALIRRQAELTAARLDDLAEVEAIDMTFPAPPLERGHLHLLVETEREIVGVFERLGYHVEQGPEVETDWYNFGALNMPRGHPARDTQDSFFFDEDLLLRTQTSPVQVRAMERLKTPPIYVVCPGRTYRRDATDASHLAGFMQLEGLAVDDGITVGDLKGTLQAFTQEVFGADRRVRLRPHHFQFTEPSFEVDVSCGVCGGTGCRSCGGEGWLEAAGCGMVHPQVLRNGGVDPDRYTGFAFGFGIERIAMLRHDVEDIRLFYWNDLRFLKQF
jgi:phenylalanyl-tRNA synthetase alpha chain